MTGWLKTCHHEVTRNGELQPCGTMAVALRRDDDPNEDPYPVCAYHCRGNMVPLGHDR